MQHTKLAYEVELKVGDIVYWDDRPGWQGKIIAIHSTKTQLTLIDVQYTDPDMHGLIDREMNPLMYTVEG